MVKSTESTVLLRTIEVLIIGSLGFLLNVLYTRLLTHNLSLELYGDFTVAMRSLVLVSQIITFGIGLSAQRFVSRYIKMRQPRKIQGFITWSLLLLLRTSFFLAIAYGLFWLTATITHLTEIHRFDQYHLALFVMIFAPLFSIFTFFVSMIMASGYVLLSTIIGRLLNRVVQIATVLIFFHFFIPKEIYHLSIMLVSILFVSMTLSIALYILLPENEIFHILEQSKKRFIDDSWLRVAESACLNTIMFTLAFTADLYILEIFSPQENHVGIFSVCEVCVGLLSTLQGAINTQLSTEIMNLDILKDKARVQLQRSLDVYNIIKLLMVIASACMSWIFRQEIFSFFNIHETTAYLLLPIMFVNVYLFDTRYQFSYLVSCKDMDFINRIQATSTGMMIIGSLILVIPYNMYGIVVATGLSRIFSKAALTLRCRQFCSMRLNLFA